MKKEPQIIQYPSTHYPSIVGSSSGWWHKPFHPAISIVILIISIICVFLLGVWFADQYSKIWSQTERRSELLQTE